MTVPVPLLQIIVDRIIKDVGYNINVMDAKGTVVASGEASRIGSFHAAALQSLSEERRVDISGEATSCYVGSRPGINQPFYHNGKLAGVIGITGPPQEIENLSRVVQSMLEIMIDREMLRQKLADRRSNITLLVHELIQEDGIVNSQRVLDAARQLNFDLSLPRSVLLIDVEESPEAPHSHGDEKRLQAIRDSDFHVSQDILSIVSFRRILIIKTNKGIPQENLLPNWCGYTRALKNHLENRLKSQVHLGMGSLCHDFHQLPQSYAEARYVLEAQRSCQNLPPILHPDFGQGKDGFHIHSMLTNYLYSKLPTDIPQRFFSPFHEKIKAQVGLVETMLAQAATHFHISESAKLLGVHRNTVLFRLNKIRELTGINPTHSTVDRSFIQMYALYAQNKQILDIRNKTDYA
ncbi:MAG: helix-turn-helix domain-containing protein [Spirochaetales bacterium]|nr:helix-turn-helix domain-containing protein [Spirochaetales bacterium]